MWAANAHTAPGTYFPSCPTKLTRAAVASGSGEPRSARTARQASIMHHAPAIAAASESDTEYQGSRTSAAEACGHAEYRPYPQHARKVASRPIRVHRFVATRLSIGSAYRTRTCSIYSGVVDRERARQTRRVHGREAPSLDVPVPVLRGERAGPEGQGEDLDVD